MAVETLADFRRRTDAFIWDSFPQGELCTHPQLCAKVCAESGELRPFWGNTVVFCLPEPVRRWLGDVQDLLYAQAADLLAARLAGDSLHITLHDLVSGADREQVQNEVARTREQARRLVAELVRREEDLHLRPTAAFNMVNTSLVLGFEPAEETTCSRLMEGYALLHQVRRLDYQLTPHVTLAYYRPGCMDAAAVGRLRALAAQINAQWKPEITLNTRMLAYQEFSDMNRYDTV